MADLALSVTITRDFLGLSALQCNDGVKYRASVQLLGSMVVWSRTTLESDFMDGGVTTRRHRQMVQEPLSFEVYGRATSGGSLSGAQLQANMNALVAAFTQDSYTLTVTVDGATYAYTGEAADYGQDWTGPRFMAVQGKVTLQMPRQPVGLLGQI